MAGLNFVLDTDVIADFINGVHPVQKRLRAALDGNRIVLCQPVYYEVVRGLAREFGT